MGGINRDGEGIKETIPLYNYLNSDLFFKKVF